MNEQDFERIDGMIARHVGTFADSIQYKLDLVVEGHQMLSEKIDGVETRLSKRMDCMEHKLDVVAAKGDVTATKLDAVSVKLDAVAADLKAHRADTEVHKKVYKVKEENLGT
jgi:uncharacterized protein (UPF0218 family)